MTNNFFVKGCPVADGKTPCNRCGGNWPGTKITSEKLTKSILSGKINPDKLGCLPLMDNAKHGINLLKELKKELTMRKARIKRILSMIEKIWEKHPDQRFGQLLFNYAGFQDSDYFVEDDIIEEKIKDNWNYFHMEEML